MNFNIVLFEPEKPLNTGNIGRTCVLTDSSLHIINPSFSLDEKDVKRAGLDYWVHVDLHVYDTFDEFYKKHEGSNIYICTTKGKNLYTDMTYKRGDFFLFGKESCGLPERIMDIIDNNHKIRVPMISSTTRSLNLSNTANIVLYEALRQTGFSNMK